MIWKMRKPKRNFSTKQLNYDTDYFDVIKKIRGIKDLDGFLSPDEDVLKNGKLMKNMDVVTERIKEAIYNGEKIGISYDCKQNV